MNKKVVIIKDFNGNACHIALSKISMIRESDEGKRALVFFGNNTTMTVDSSELEVKKLVEAFWNYE